MSIAHADCPEGVLEHIAQGQRMVILTGCSSTDLVVSDGRPREIRREFYALAQRRFDMAILEARLGHGFQFVSLGLEPDVEAKIRRNLSGAGILQESGLGGPEAGYGSEVVQVREAFERLRRFVESGRELPPLMIHVPHAHDLVGHPDGVAATGEANIALTHLLVDLSNNYAMRGYRIFVLLEGDVERMDPRLAESLPVVRCAFPRYEEKLSFLQCLQTTKAHQGASLAEGLTLESIAQQSANTPNRGTEEIFYGSARTSKPVELTVITERKREDIRRESEGVFEQQDTRGVEGVKLEGLSAQALYSSLQIFIRSLMARSPWSFQVVVIAGGPGTSKTVAVQLACRDVSLMKWNSPKHHLVGMSEARARRASQLVREWPGNVYFRDEIDSLYGMNRNQLDRAGDSGSSAAEVAEFLNLTSDEALCGNALIIGTTNRPNVFAGAFGSRFELVPAFRPVRSDYPAILESVCNRLAGRESVSREDDIVVEAGNVFYEKQLFARELIRAIRRTMLIDEAEALYPEHVLKAALEAAEPSIQQIRSFEYSELMSLRLSSSVRYFPWYGRMENFEFPAYLAPLVDSEGKIKADDTDQYLKDLEPHANV